MACFIVPATEAIITTVATKVIEKKEDSTEHIEEVAIADRFSTKLHKLNGFLWGGSALLAFEHFWHGEIMPVFPFLSGASEPAEMFHEMGTVGVSMALLTTLVWGITTVVAAKVSKKEKEVTEV